MEHITANAVIRHSGLNAGFEKHPMRCYEVDVDGAEAIDFEATVKVVRVTVGDWDVAWDGRGIVTVYSAVDDKRCVYYVYWLPDRYKLAGWLYRRVG